MFDSHYVGMDVVSAENNGKYKPISRVTLMLDDGNALTSGDDTGRELIADCPHATQEMVDNLLASLKGHIYQAFEAAAANIDPAAERGDAATVDGMYGVIAQIDDDGSGYVGLSAPGEAELEDEYPSEGPMTREFNRQIAATRSYISKTAEQIRLEVSNELEGLSASVDVKVDSISAEVLGTQNAISLLELEVDGITQRVQDAEGNLAEMEVTASGLSARIDDVEGGYAEVSVELDGLSSSIGTAEGDISTLQQTINGLTYTDKSGTTFINGSSVRTDNLYVEAANVTGTITAGIIEGSTVYLKEDGLTAATFSLTGAGSYRGRKLDIASGAIAIVSSYGSTYLESGSGTSLELTDSAFFGADVCPPINNADGYCLGLSYAKWNDIYTTNSPIQTSDRTKKTDINYDLNKYDAFFDQLAPCSGRFVNGKRTHMFLIAQDVEQDMIDNGISDMDFAGWIKSPKCDENGNPVDGEHDYALRYAEFTPLLIAQVQNLKNRVKELERLGSKKSA